MEARQQLVEALEKGFMNDAIVANERLQPRLLSNNANGQVLPTLLQELATCHSFTISVAFITSSGLVMLKSVLQDLALKGVRGRILTSTYLGFNNPKAFEELMKIPNVDVRLTSIPGFHAKGYIFDQGSYETLIVGSSNLTDSALKTNYEWNVKLNSLSQGDLIQRFNEQFEHAWKDATPLSQQWIDMYRQTYKPMPKRQVTPFPLLPGQVAEAALAASFETEPTAGYVTITPNKMQTQALAQIQQVRDSGEKRALVVSATGTGKTYLSAFDVRQYAPKKMLFIVHREQILEKAMSDYQKVLGGDKADYGKFVGSTQQTDARYLFATIQTLSKLENLARFDREAFDYILIDEVHKAGAPSYLRLLDYFEPAFLLGMTATPERTDQFNIFELFDYNIAYEIRLQEALEEEMLCPFHYFGVTDFERDDYVIDENMSIDQLMLDERVNHVIEKVEYYGHAGDAVKGLIFCSRKEEAKQLSQKLNARGYRTMPLTGEDSTDVREAVVEQLEAGELDYILTVDVFNEGIDIPVVNQIVMLRQTQSSIIFIQQLGRGLRKHDSKDYVVILDFIGNYKNNYMIPMALAGDNTYNKDNLRRNTMDMAYIKGVSSVHFEEIAKNRIFEAINQKTLITIRELKAQFEQLSNRLGHQPMLIEFIEHHSVDPEVLLTKRPNYHEFLMYVDKDLAALPASQNTMLTFLSQELMDGKRMHELLLLKALIAQPTVSKTQYIELLQQHELTYDEETITSVERFLDLSFFVSSNRTKYADALMLEVHEDMYTRTSSFEVALKNDLFIRYVEDIFACANEKSTRYAYEQLKVGEKYSRKDYCRLMNWSSDMSATMYGYKIDEPTNTCPLFITYHKDDSLSSETLYEDELLNPSTLKWFTRPNNRVNSKQVERILHSPDLRIDVFIKKEGGEGTDYFYLGKAKPNVESAEDIQLMHKGVMKPYVTLKFELEAPVPEAIYRYLVGV